MKAILIRINLHQYIHEIKPYLKDIIDNLKKSKIQLTIAINFISSKETDKELVMHAKSEIIETMIYKQAEVVIQELFKSLLPRYQIGLESSMKGSDLILK